ncbi:MAG TPA: hypothetical protein VLM90_13560, partial [Candidatus Deferrimicrobium sp.]|nr:hypothetical protein [Candidatus Deferrimicrobium sp.]
RMTGNRVFFKLENLQMTGSFKERGALNRLLTLSVDEAQHAVIAGAGVSQPQVKHRRHHRHAGIRAAD